MLGACMNQFPASDFLILLSWYNKKKIIGVRNHFVLGACTERFLTCDFLVLLSWYNRFKQYITVRYSK